jgi:ribulose-phosphate 3-epimerase
LIDDAGRSEDVALEIDGGVGPTTIAGAAAAGVDVFVAGSSLFRDPLGRDHAVRELRALADQARAA